MAAAVVASAMGVPAVLEVAAAAAAVTVVVVVAVSLSVVVVAEVVYLFTEAVPPVTTMQKTLRVASSARPWAEAPEGTLNRSLLPLALLPRWERTHPLPASRSSHRPHTALCPTTG